MIGCYLILYLSKNFYLDYAACALFGVGQGLSYLAPIRTACYYFPERKGFVTGFILAGYGLSAAFLNIIIRTIVNPNNRSVSKNGYYEEEVYNNVPNYLLIAIIAFSCLCLSSILLIQKYEDNEINDSSQISALEKNNDSTDIILIQNINQDKQSFKVKDLILSRQTLYFGLLAYCSYCKYINYLISIRFALYCI